MPVIAVVNRKGGSGKSTLATHLAAYCATHGLPAMLGDVDRQQSTQTWLRLRSARQPQGLPLVGWALDPKNVLRPPAGTTHVILDTPGGLRGFDLARVAGYADAILMPVCNSVFDRDSAAACHAELMTLPRVASGRCKVGVIGMRLDARTRGAEAIAAWAQAHAMDFVGHLRETQTYVRNIEQGLTLFDMPASKVETDLAQWAPILEWLAPVLQPSEHEPLHNTAAPATPSVPVSPLRVPSPPADPQALAKAARASLPVPANLGELSSGRGVRGSLERWFGPLLKPRSALRNP